MAKNNRTGIFDLIAVVDDANVISLETLVLVQLLVLGPRDVLHLLGFVVEGAQ